MEDWIKHQAEEFELTPKGENWDHIQSVLDADKHEKSKKRRILVLLWVLPLFAFLLGYYFHKSQTPTLSKVQNENSVGSSPSNTKSPIQSGATGELENVTSKPPETTQNNNPAPFLTENNSKSGLTEVTHMKRNSSSPSDEIPAATSFPSGSETKIAPHAQPIKPNLFHSGLKMVPSFASLIKRKVNQDKQTDSAPKNKRFRTESIYLSYAVGGNRKCNTTPSIQSHTLFENTSSKLQNNIYQQVELGSTITLSQKLSLSLGLGIYSARWKTYMGGPVQVQHSITSPGTGISNPAQGFNASKDTLYIVHAKPFQSYSQQTIYSLENKTAFQNQIQGISIPYRLSMDLIKHKQFTTSVSAGGLLMLERKYDVLRYSSDFEVYVQEAKKHSFLQLSSVQMEAGLQLEYRLKQWGITTSPSVQLPVYNRNHKNGISSSNLCRFTLGLGLNYHLQ